MEEVIFSIPSSDGIDGSDIELTYDKENDVYNLYIETAYAFGSLVLVVDYYRNLLSGFASWMIENNYALDEVPDHDCLFSKIFKYNSVEQAYACFKTMVLGYTHMVDDMAFTIAG